MSGSFVLGLILVLALASVAFAQHFMDYFDHHHHYDQHYQQPSWGHYHQPAYYDYHSHWGKK